MIGGQLQWEKVLEWPQGEACYLLHVVVDPQQISIEVEDKYSGQLWQSLFSNAGIQQLTTKAKNPKKYPVFVRMLLTALSRTNDSLSAEILSYRQLSSRFGKPLQSKSLPPEQAAKRFLILSYASEFERMQFPLPLMHEPDAPPERLRLTLRRLAQELQIIRDGNDQDTLSREVGLLKYENESLRGKLKGKTDSKNDDYHKEEMQRELADKNGQLQAQKAKIDELERKCIQNERKAQQTEEKNKQLQRQLKQKEKEKEKDRGKNDYGEKLEQLIVQMGDLAEELQYAKEKEKKSQMKIDTLQKELEVLLTSKQTKSRVENRRFDNSSPQSRKSETELSVRSGKSGRSQKSQGKSKNLQANSNLTKKNYGVNPTTTNRRPSNHRKSSIYDSDTQSSRMRKLNNGRSSPYRQPAPVQQQKRKTRQNERSRSKSKQRMTSPKTPAVVDSQVFTEGYQSGDSSDEHIEKIDNYLRNLKEKKGVKPAKPMKATQPSRIESRMQTLQDMIKKAAQSTRTKN